MAKALIKLKEQGLSSVNKPFEAIYGTFTTGAVGYVVGAYTIPFENVASIYAGEVVENFKTTLVLD